MEIEATFICVYCMQVNSITVDGTGGTKQRYIEECQVCCRPNDLTITVDDDLASAQVYAEMA